MPPVKTLKINGSVFKNGGLQSQSFRGIFETDSTINKFPGPVENSENEQINLEGDKVLYSGNTSRKPFIPLKVDNTNKTNSDKKSSSEFEATEFEKLTNISVRRPEIISLLPFQPIYSDFFPEKTNEGKLFDVFIQTMKRLDETATELSLSNDLNSLADSNNKIYYREVTQIRTALQNFYNAYRSLAKIRGYLDVLNPAYTFSASTYINKNINGEKIDKGRIENYIAKKSLSIKDNLKNLTPSSSRPYSGSDSYSATKTIVSILNECYYLTHASAITTLEESIVSQAADSPIILMNISKAKRVSLNNYRDSPLLNVSFEDLGNFSVTSSDDQKKLEKSLEIIAKSTGVDLNELTENARKNAANTVLIDSVTKAVEETLKLMKTEISEKLVESNTAVDHSAKVFHLLSKELRHSKLYDQNKLGNFATAIETVPADVVGKPDPMSVKISKSVFGTRSSDMNVFSGGIQEQYKDSLMGLCYFPKEPTNNGTGKVNTNEKVLTFEKSKKKEFKTGFESGLEYFFDPETLIQLSGVGKAATIKSNSSYNSPRNNNQNTLVATNNLSVQARSRIESLHSRIKKCDEDFFTFLTEMGGLPQKDDVFFDGTKCKYVSNDPTIFFNNIWDAIRDKVSTKIDNLNSFLNTGYGAKAILAFIGKNDPTAEKIMSRVFLMVMSQINETKITNYSNLDNLLMRSFNGFTTPSSASSSYQDKINSIFNTIKGLLSIGWFSPGDAGRSDQGDYYQYEKQASEYFGLPGSKKYEMTKERGRTDGIFDEDLEESLPTKKLLQLQTSENLFICQYATTAELGDSLRNSPLFKLIVDIMRDVKTAFSSYAIKSTGKTAFSEIDMQTIMLMFFQTICKIIYNVSATEIVFAQRDSLLGQFYPDGGEGRAELAEQFTEDVEIDIAELRSLGILSSKNDGTFELSIAYRVIDISSEPEKTVTKIYNKIKEEMTFLTTGYLTVSNTLSTLEKGISEANEIFSKLNAKDYLKIINYMGDPNKLTFLLKEPQLTLMLSNIEDVYQSFQDFSEEAKVTEGNKHTLFNRYYDRLTHSEKMVTMLNSLFSSHEFRSLKGYNKKIISVGLAQDLLKSITVEGAKVKQNDIFKLSIYKIDLLNSDIIYKPKTYLFEASRYPVRVYKDIKNYEDSLTGIPTRNYTMFFQGVTDEADIKYWEDMSNMFDETYSFLNKSEKEEILINHAASFLLENYIKIMTGLMINETTFNITPEEAEALLNEYENGTNAAEVKSLLDKQTKQKAAANLSSSAGKPKLDGKVIKEINEKTMQAVVEVATKLNLTPVAATLKFLIQPKKFDRVFHIIFDPEFTVDQEKTKKTYEGQLKLQQLIDSGKLVEKRRVGLNAEYIDVDKSSDDTTMETFFVVAESHYPKNVKMSEDLIDKLPNSFLEAIGIPLGKKKSNQSSSPMPFNIKSYFNK